MCIRDSLPSLLSHLKVKDEAMAALLTLGFATNSVDKTLDSILKKNPVSTVEDLIKQALKSLWKVGAGLPKKAILVPS